MNLGKVPQKKRTGILLLLVLFLMAFAYGYSQLLFVSSRGLLSEFRNDFGTQTKSPGTVQESNSLAFGYPESQENELGKVQGVTTESSGEVRAVEDNITENSLVFRLRVFFLDAIEAVSARFDTDLEVGNDVVIGNDVSVGNSLVVSNDLVVDDSLTVSGNLVAPNVIYSLLAGDGVSVTDGQDITITNSDTGSAQNIFKNVVVNGDTITANDNDDTLTLEGSSGINLSNDGKTITIAGSGADLNVSGWYDDGTAVRLVSSSDNVGIGTSNPGYKLHVVGTSYFSGVANFASGTIVSSGINNSSGGITNAGSITGATGFTSSGTVTFSDLSTGVLQSNVNGVVSSSALNLSSGALISGILPVTNGGTGISSLNTGDMLYASAANTLSALGAGSEGDVLTMSSGVPAWGTASGGSSPCPTCIVNNPGSSQTITPSAGTATALVLKQASGGSVDVFRVENNDGSSVYFRIDSSGNVALGDNTTSGTFTVSPASTDPITIDPVAQGAGSYEGTITSLDLTAARSWQFPNESGVVCLATGNCAGTSAGIGGSGTTNYLTKWSDTYDVTTSIVYDDGNNVGIGTTTMNSLLDVAGTLNVDALASFGGDVSIDEHATISGSLRVDQMVDLNSTLGVTGATTLGNTLDVTGLATFGGNVGIGSAAPSQKLDVVGAIRLGTAGANNVLNTSAAGSAPTGVLYWGDRSICDSSGNCSGTSASVGGSGSTNYIAKWNSAYGLTDSVLYDDGTNVGIGSTNPGYLLDVAGTTASTFFLSNNDGFQISSGAGGQARLGVGSSSNFVGSISNNAFSIRTNNADRVYINNSGLVGIGTTTNTGLLTVQGAVTGKALTILNELGNQNIISASASGSPRFTVGNTGVLGVYNEYDQSTSIETVGYGVGSGWIQFNAGGTNGTIAAFRDCCNNVFTVSNTSGTSDFNYNLNVDGDFTVDTDTLVVDATGNNVGIGTDSPVAALDVTGRVKLDNGSAGSPTLTFDNNDTTGFYATTVGGGNFIFASGGQDRFHFGANAIQSSNTSSFYLQRAGGSATDPVYTFNDDWDTGLGRATADELVLITGGAERMRIDTNGNVGIGTTDPGYLLDVDGDIYSSSRGYFSSGVSIGTTSTAEPLVIDGGGIRILDSNEGIQLGNTQEVIQSTVRGIASQVRGGWEFHINANNSLAEPNEDFVVYSRTSIGGGGTPLFKIEEAGNIGIGTDTPGADLHIEAPSGNSANVILNGASNSHAYYQFQEGGTTQWIWGHYGTNNDLRFANSDGLWGGSDDQYLVMKQSTFRVGFSTINPDRRLELNTRGAEDGLRISYNDFDGSATNYGELLVNSSGDLTVNATADVLLSPTGNVGIGTTDPSYELDIVRSADRLVGFRVENPNTGIDAIGGFGVAGDAAEGGLFVFSSNYTAGAGLSNLQNRMALAGDSVNTLNGIDFISPAAGSDFRYYIGGFSSSNEVMRLNSSGNLGIGTNNPVEKLDVMGNIKLADTNFIGLGSSAGRISFADSSTDYLIIRSAKVGINASPEDAVGSNTPALIVSQPNSNSVVLSLHNNDGTISIDQVLGELMFDADDSPVDGGVAAIQGVAAEGFSSSNKGSYLTFDTTLIGTNSRTERMRISDDGNVGIGTTDATAKLDVAGDIYFDSRLVTRQDTNTLISFNNNDQIELQAGGLRILTLNESGSFSGSVTGNQNSHNVDFNWRGDTNSSMFMLDASSENVGIGTATPGQTLDVVGSARFSAVGSGTYANDLNLTSDGTLTTSSSDIRLKENFISMDDAEILSKILQLQTYSFNWKQDGSSDIGLIAQEVDTIFPEITFTNQTDGYMGINYSRLPTLLVSAVQEQQQQLSRIQLQLDQSGRVAVDKNASNTADSAGEYEQAPSAQEQLANYLTFSDTITFLRSVVFKVKTQFLATVEFMQEVRFRGAVKFNSDTVGTFSVPADSTRVRVTFSSEFSQVPTVFLSAQSSLSGGYQVEDVSTRGFVVTLAQPQPDEKVFDWFAVLSDQGSGSSVEVLESSTTSSDNNDGSDSQGTVLENQSNTDDQTDSDDPDVLEPLVDEPENSSDSALIDSSDETSATESGSLE